VGVELLHENLDPDPAPASSSSSSVRRPRGRAPEENWPAIYAGTEPLVVVIQSQLKRPSNQRHILRGPIPTQYYSHPQNQFLGALERETVTAPFSRRQGDAERYTFAVPKRKSGREIVVS
jgi:hypothetical protein